MAEDMDDGIFSGVSFTIIPGSNIDEAEEQQVQI